MFAVDGGTRQQLEGFVAAADAAYATGNSAAHLRAAAPLAYAVIGFDEGTTVTQVLMRAPRVSQAMLTKAQAQEQTMRSFGFNSWSTPHHAPPAPIEFVDPLARLQELSGDLLAEMVLFSIIVNHQGEHDQHVAHYDPSAFEAISAVNLGEGEVTFQLLDPSNNMKVEVEMTLVPGQAYVLVGRAVRRLKHKISTPRGGVRFGWCLPCVLPCDCVR
jgi:hypothetical protein